MSGAGSTVSSAGAGVTTKSGSPPRRRSSTEPGASSRVISSAAADSASSSISRIADSSGAVRRSASARASSPPASAAHGELAAWGERLWRRPVAYGSIAVVVLVVLALPVFGLKTGMPSIKVVPSADSSRVGYTQVQHAFGQGAPGAIQIATTQRDAQRVTAIANADPGVAQVMPALPGAGGAAMVHAIPNADPSAKAVGRTVDRLRSAVPPGALVGGSVAENHDLEQLLAAKTPLVIGVVLTLGFLLLLVALQAPIIAALGVLTNLLATGAAFGCRTSRAAGTPACGGARASSRSS